jgi:hypothetical protein
MNQLEQSDSAELFNGVIEIQDASARCSKECPERKCQNTEPPGKSQGNNFDVLRA